MDRFHRPVRVAYIRKEPFVPLFKKDSGEFRTIFHIVFYEFYAGMSLPDTSQLPFALFLYTRKNLLFVEILTPF